FDPKDMAAFWDRPPQEIHAELATFRDLDLFATTREPPDKSYLEDPSFVERNSALILEEATLTDAERAWTTLLAPRTLHEWRSIDSKERDRRLDAHLARIFRFHGPNAFQKPVILQHCADLWQMARSSPNGGRQAGSAKAYSSAPGKPSTRSSSDKSIR